MKRMILNRPSLNLLAIFALCFLGFIMSVIWNGADKVSWLNIFVAWLLGSIEPASAMAEPPSLYFLYGHFTLIFYGLILAHLKTVKVMLSNKVFNLSFLLLSLAVVGDVIAYWLSEFYGVGLRSIGFWSIELPALVSLILFWFSIGVYRSVKHKNINGLVWVLPMALLSVAVIQYMPHSLLLAILVSLNMRALLTPKTLVKHKPNYPQGGLNEIGG